MKESKIFSGQNLTEIVHYVYRVTIDEHYYIGKHTGLLNDLKTGRYKTSSNLVHEKLRNGMTFSKIKILKVFSTEKDALEYERRFLRRVKARTNPKFLNQHNGNGNYTLKQHTEKTKEKISEIKRELYDENTELGRKRREDMSKKGIERFNPNTEEGRKRREDMSNKRKDYYNTEEGRKLREINSEFMKEKAKEQLQKRQDASILGELMFDEVFIKENFLIIDDKNNSRFLWSVYSKLTGYKKSSIAQEKREGKLNFLYGINSISISEEQENAKIEEIEAIIKSRNEELSLKAS